MLQLRLRGQRMWELERTFARDRMAISRFTRDLSREIHTRWRHLLTWDGEKTSDVTVSVQLRRISL